MAQTVSSSLFAMYVCQMNCGNPFQTATAISDAGDASGSEVDPSNRYHSPVFPRVSLKVKTPHKYLRESSRNL